MKYHTIINSQRKVNSWMPAFAGMTALVVFIILLLSSVAIADEAKHYNFGTHPHPIDQPEAAEATPSEEAPKTEQPASAEVPAPQPTSKIVNGVYSPNGKTSTSAAPVPTPVHNKAKDSENAEQLVRFFIGSCFKFYGRNDDMIKYMDDHFPRLEAERKAVFAPVINATVTTQYWDVVRDDKFYMLAKDTGNGKCDVIAKDGASTAIHKELKAVMDGLTISNIVQTKTDYEKIPNLNKEVSIVNVLGHPLEKELGIVATTQIKETGDNMAAILTLFTVPQETVEVK